MENSSHAGSLQCLWVVQVQTTLSSIASPGPNFLHKFSLFHNLGHPSFQWWTFTIVVSVGFPRYSFLSYVQSAQIRFYDSDKIQCILAVTHLTGKQHSQCLNPESWSTWKSHPFSTPPSFVSLPIQHVDRQNHITPPPRHVFMS